jgi:hypothetical protein
MVVAIVALIASLTGGAVALSGKHTVDSNDLKRGAVTGRAIAPGAVTAPKVDGVLAAATAYVDAGQRIVPGRSRGMGDATARLEGSYVCFRGLPFKPRTLQATAVRLAVGAEPASVDAFGPGDNPACAGREQASVRLLPSGGPLPGFYVAFYR